MKSHLYTYFLVLILLVIIDCIWLFLTAEKIYHKYLYHLLASSVTVWPVALFYALYAGGLYFFVVRHGINNHVDLLATFGSGLLLGLLAYSAYDLTNQATLRGWPIFITILDIAWGTILSGIVAVISTFIAKRFIS